MSREIALARGRVAAELSMKDACVIRRITGKATNRATAEVTPTYTTLYTGKCRVQQHQAAADQRVVGEDQVFMLQLEVQLPAAGTEGLDSGDEITLTAAANDADLVGRVLLIHDLAHASEKTARRVQVRERTGS